MLQPSALSLNKIAEQDFQHKAPNRINQNLIKEKLRL
jgi:hypothetical protein